MIKKDIKIIKDTTLRTNKLVGEWSVEIVEMEFYGNGPPRHYIKDEQGNWIETIRAKED